MYLWCARHIQGVTAAHGKTADVHGMEAIDILVQRDGIQHTSLIDMFGQRKLDQDAVDLWVCIIVCHNLHNQKLKHGLEASA